MMGDDETDLPAAEAAAPVADVTVSKVVLYLRSNDNELTRFAPGTRMTLTVTLPPTVAGALRGSEICGD